MSSKASQHVRSTVGANIRSGRLAKGLSQHELAVAIEAGDAMYVSRWERGKTRPNALYEARLAEILFDGDIAALYGEAREAPAA